MIRKTLNGIFNLICWVAGLFMLIVGFVGFAASPVIGAIVIGLSLAMIPPLRRRIWRGKGRERDREKSVRFDKVPQHVATGFAEQQAEPEPEAEPEEEKVRIEYVYLMKSGRHYKIGKTNNLKRREREIRIEMPEKLVVIHHIETDDPFGIESYWHKRFSGQRRNGEWFELSTKDVKVFCSREKM